MIKRAVKSISKKPIAVKKLIKRKYTEKVLDGLLKDFVENYDFGEQFCLDGSASNNSCGVYEFDSFKMVVYNILNYDITQNENNFVSKKVIRIKDILNDNDVINLIYLTLKILREDNIKNSAFFTISVVKGMRREDDVIEDFIDQFSYLSTPFKSNPNTKNPIRLVIFESRAFEGYKIDYKDKLSLATKLLLLNGQ
jgi:hypothetical protein